MLRFLSWTLSLGLGTATAALIGGYVHLMTEMTAAGPLPNETSIEIERGWGFARISGALADAGMIDNPLMFRLGARLESRDRDLKAGEYLIPAAASPDQILDILESGQAIQYRIAVPEGLTTTEVLALVAGHPDLTGELPDPLPEEGTLLPETYFFDRGTERAVVLERMAQAMTEALETAWDDRQEDLPLQSMAEALVLASIIEKETALPEEYQTVAGVFVNRLRKGMLLQTDPTVIYALTGGEGALGRKLFRGDLDIDNPYNTYVYPGLPPGPIANPGLGALEAAMHPADTAYLYFVADGTGGHVFAETLEEHNRNAAEWRRIRDNQ